MIENNRFFIIGRKSCPFCVHAIDFCKAKNYKYQFFDFSHNLEALEEYKANVHVLSVPGAYEIPYIVGKYLKYERPYFDAIITMGAIIRGETPHFEIISQSISDSILQANMRGKIPIIFGVLTTNSADQARERASYKGKELALSTLSVLDIVFDG